ncbi:MAG: ankyrin repeat domain-containing protein [Gammaproteobacteria bacterium]
MSNLHAAIHEGNLSKVQMLIEKAGYNPNYTGFFGFNQTPISLAAQLGKVEIAEYLIEKGAAVNQRGYWGWGTDSFSAAQKTNDISMQALLLDKADVSKKSELAQSLLSIALSDNNAWALNKLTTSGILIHNKEFANSLFFKAIAEDKSWAVQPLLKANNLEIDVNSQHGYFERTALLEAASKYQVETVKALLAAGAEVQVTDVNQWTPLHYATAKLGGIQLMTVLLEHGADANALDEAGRSPLFFCLEDAQAVKLLVNHNASINLPDINDITPLQLAILNNSSVGVKVLVELGANVDYNPNIGFSPLHYAVEHGSTKAAIQLIKSGASILETQDGKTAIELAQEYGNKTALSFLKAEYHKLGLDLPEEVVKKPIVETVQSNAITVAEVLGASSSLSTENDDELFVEHSADSASHHPTLSTCVISINPLVDHDSIEILAFG